jgi:hypothetical protein
MSEFSDDDIKELLRVKCLLMKGEDTYDFAIPSAGAAIASLDAGRRKLTGYMKRRPAHLAERSNVERQLIDGSIFYGEFHVQDLIGAGVFEVVQCYGRREQIHLIYDPYQQKRTAKVL